MTVLETLANIGLIFYLFSVGLELDVQSLRRTGKRALAISLAGISIPFALGVGTSAVLPATIAKGGSGPAFLVFMGVALSITAFPVLARILAELKLLTTDVGRTVMSAAAVDDVAAWVLLALAVSLSGDGPSRSHLIPVWILLSGIAFIGFAFVAVRPAFARAARCFPNGESVGEAYICATLAAVLAAAFVTDAIGIHALFGAFVMGVLMPKEGGFSRAMVEKVEDLVSGLFLPLFFVSSGLKTDISTIRGVQSWGLLVLVIVTACVGKILGTVGVSLASKIPCREALVIGFLMNTKGLVELIVLNIGKDRNVLNDQTFAIMVLMALFTTFITTPIVIALYKPARFSNHPYKDSTIETSDSDAELRLMACFHSSLNIPSIINLVEASRGSQRPTGLLVYAMHLTELTERSSAILMVHKARRNGLPFWDKRRRSAADEYVVGFEAFQQLSKVSVRHMTAISSFSDMHKDICVSADRKRVAMVILPFHKHQRLDGALETSRAEFRHVNRKVLEEARCSVGILVDRGLGGQTHISASNLSSSIAVLFFGGADDREALAFGMRMAEHPGVQLTVVRFNWEPNHGDDNGIAISVDKEAEAKNERENEAALAHVVKRKGKSDEMVQYEEKVVRSEVEIVGEVQKVSRCNLVLVGRRPEGLRTESLVERSECPELGPFGSVLASNHFAATASVLVVQKFTGEAVDGVDG